MNTAQMWRKYERNEEIGWPGRVAGVFPGEIVVGKR
jgi:hypothetical protein